jgi:hypothetical protein
MTLTLVRPDAAVDRTGSWAIQGSTPRRGPAELRESVTVFVDAAPVTVRDALGRADVTGQVERFLESLGVRDRAALEPTLLEESSQAVRWGFVWRHDPHALTEEVFPWAFETFDAPGHVKLSSEVSARLAADGRAVASVTTRVVATDDDTDARLRGAWGIVGGLVRSVAKATLAAVKEQAEELEERRIAA